MAKNRSVREVDFGYSTAREYWSEIVLPSYERFRENQKRYTAIEASWPAWHVHEWVWYDANPDVNPERNSAFASFREQLLNDCPELAWVRDIADAGKHRYLGRSAEVQRVHPTSKALSIGPGMGFLATGSGGILMASAGLEIELTDGTKHYVSAVLDTVIEFWRGRFEVQQPLA
jgi:hypothetical protein